MRPIPCKIGDMEWPSKRAASRHFGITLSLLEYYLDRGMEHLFLEGRRIERTGRVVTIDGVTYPSASAAGRAIGKSTTYVLRKYGAN